jgi:tRNA (cytidine/uridine-2'-O-)-methyltransferase
MKMEEVYRFGEDLLNKEDLIITQKPALVYENEGFLSPQCKQKLLQFHPEVVLYCPQIPPNTGTIARTCAAFCCRLHLIEPMGFHITEKSLRRAGLDYWQHVEVFVHKNWEDFLRTRFNRRLLFVETGGSTPPLHFHFQPGDVLVFGAETFGIPKHILSKHLSSQEPHQNAQLTIPLLQSSTRSLNLSNTVSIVLYLAVAKINEAFCKIRKS